MVYRDLKCREVVNSYMSTYRYIVYYWSQLILFVLLRLNQPKVLVHYWTGLVISSVSYTYTLIVYGHNQSQKIKQHKISKFQSTCENKVSCLIISIKQLHSYIHSYST